MIKPALNLVTSDRGKYWQNMQTKYFWLYFFHVHCFFVFVLKQNKAYVEAQTPGNVSVLKRRQQMNRSSDEKSLPTNAS